MSGDTWGQSQEHLISPRETQGVVALTVSCPAATVHGRGEGWEVFDTMSEGWVPLAVCGLKATDNLLHQPAEL